MSTGHRNDVGARYLAQELHAMTEQQQDAPQAAPTGLVEIPRPATGPVWQRAVMSAQTIIVLAAISGCTVESFTGRYGAAGGPQ